jgi:hypothetical protein
MKIYLITLLVAFTCINSFAQENPDSIAFNTDLDGGKIAYVDRPDNYELDSFITMESVLIDVNERTGNNKLQFGADYEFTFNLTNVFQQHIAILGFSKPCFCITPNWHKTPIAPGSVGFIKIKYTATIIGTSQKTLRAYLYDAVTMKAVGKIDFEIKATVNNINSPN